MWWAGRLCLLLLALSSIPAPISCQKKLAKPRTSATRSTNWTALLSQPSAFVQRAHSRLKKRPEGYKPSSACNNGVGMGYLEGIRRSHFSLCGSTSASAGLPGQHHDASLLCAKSSSCRSAVDCYTAPLPRDGDGGGGASSGKAVVSLCRSHNLLLDSCKFLQGQRPGSMSKKFPLPARGAVKLACPPAKLDTAARRGSKQEWLRNVHTDVWWGNATQDNQAVFKACAPKSPSLVTTPTLFLTRDRHVNYAHELEALSMVFAFLAALEPPDVAAKGVQVVITDRAPPTGFLETWARISGPHRLRVLAHDPFPPNTCFRSAFHVYTFAGGLSYNTRGDTTSCESPLLGGLSNWLRQLYGEGEPSARAPVTAHAAAAAVAGPAAEAAGVRGLRPPAGGIVLKNVVWLSRRNLETLRLVMNASAGWRGMRMVRNEDAVVAGILAAVQEWNAESCLLRRFDRTVKAEYELSLTLVNPVHTGAWKSNSSSRSQSAAGSQSAAAAATGRRALLDLLGQRQQQQQEEEEEDELTEQDKQEEEEEEVEELDEEELLMQVSAAAAAATAEAVYSTAVEAAAAAFRQRRHHRQTLADGDAAGGGDGDGDGDDDDDDAEADDGGAAGGVATGGGGGGGSHPYMIGNNVVALDRLWEADPSTRDGCRRTNVLFKFMVADFDSDVSYHMQLATIFRTGVLAGVHGAGLAHGFFLPPGQSAVLQLLGEAFAKAPAANVFRNMAGGMGNHYEDVPYGQLDVDVEALKQAVKRSMDFVARQVMEAQMRRSGALRLVLVDQSHFSIVVPSQEQCPTNASGVAGGAGAGAALLLQRQQQLQRPLGR